MQKVLLLPLLLSKQICASLEINGIFFLTKQKNKIKSLPFILGNKSKSPCDVKCHLCSHDILILEQQPSKRRAQTYLESVSRTARYSDRKVGVKMLEQNTYQRPMSQFTIFKIKR